ncbi:MAG: hypothetical protein WCI51_20435 [Lentisphaerota bacterium]
MKKALRHICALRRQICGLMLDTPTNFYLLTNDKIAEIYNGAGPDWMSNLSRKIITFLLRYFAAAFVIHDVEYDFNMDRADTPDNRGRFHAANLRMWNNIKIIASALWPWYTPRRWWWRLKGYAAYRACENFGWSAWIAVKPEQHQDVIDIKAEIVNEIPELEE